jgi:hypothetical protein
MGVQEYLAAQMGLRRRAFKATPSSGPMSPRSLRQGVEPGDMRRPLLEILVPPLKPATTPGSLQPTCCRAAPTAPRTRGPCPAKSEAWAGPFSPEARPPPLTLPFGRRLVDDGHDVFLARDDQLFARDFDLGAAEFSEGHPITRLGPSGGPSRSQGSCRCLWPSPGLRSGFSTAVSGIRMPPAECRRRSSRFNTTR